MRRFDLLKVAIYVMVVCALAMFNSGCEKENLEDFERVSNLANSSKFAGVENVSSEMRNFDTYNDMMEEVSRLASMTTEELAEYENSIGYNSFGKVADEVYYSLFGNEEKLERMTRDDLSNLINANSEFIQIVNESDDTESAETKYYMSPFRYIMNRDCMFRVDNIVYKIFEYGYIRCSEKYYEQLKRMSEEDFMETKNGDDFYVHKYNTMVMYRESGILDDLIVRKKNSSDGKERVKIWIEYDRAAEPTSGKLHITTKGQHKIAGIFFDALRHLANNLTIKIKYPDYSIQTINENTVTSDGVPKIEVYYPTVFCWVGSYMNQITGYCQAPSARYTFPN